MLRLGAGYADPVRSSTSSTRAERARRAKETIADYCKSLVSEREQCAHVRYWPSHELFRSSGQNRRLYLELD